MQVISDSFRVRKLETNSLRTSNLSMASRDCSEWKVGFTSNECRSLGRITRYAQKCCSRLPGAFWVCCRQSRNYPETAFEQVGRIGTVKS
jgi:hypothetical protein